MGLAVGVTGGIGSGKSTVTGILTRHGWQVIDVDKLARTLIQEQAELRSRITETFGPAYFNRDILDHKALGKAVFSDPSRLRHLNQIVWPPLIESLKTEIQELKSRGAAPVAADMAVLFEANCQKLFDRILVVIAPVDDRIQRMKATRFWTEEEIKQRIAVQLDDQIKCEQADYVIHNIGNMDQLEEKTRAFIQWILSS